MTVRLDRFEYSAEFKRLVINLCRGMENSANYQEYIATQLGGQRSRVVEITNNLCPEIEYHCAPLRNKRVLDFGCGTGASTAALATYSANVCAFDIDKESLEICRKRVSEHGYDGRVEFYSAHDIQEVSDSLGSFDMVLAVGVLEHIPLSKTGLRGRTVQTVFNMLKPSGCLYIHDTPNRLWPYDFHSTRLWWGPWTKPGSEWTYRRAIRRARHSDVPGVFAGPLGLEEAGGWGVTYWEIMRYLRAEKVECVNLLKGHNNVVNHIGRTDKKERMAELIETMVAPPLAKLLRVPLAALTPKIQNLVLRRG
ncbi:MAG TPA: class I SAM-dependent methyltransferase [Thermoplasmata archaeon]|nr:class I SAM-dependent methyltransferase [Thermoplasmata archaeon]